jgi:RNA polymerase sigma-70 factor (ECF subfamily)
VEVLDDVEGLRKATQEAVASLPKGQRVVMEMAMDPEVTQEEIARVLQIPKGTVKSRLFHARKFLFEKLRPFLGRDT